MFYIVYMQLEVLCIHTLDCGDAVDAPHIHIWDSGDVEIF